MSSTFRAYVVNKTAADFSAGIKDVTLDDLSPGDVVIKVAYSGVNYKDGLASIPDGRVIRKYPLVPGVDLSSRAIPVSSLATKCLSPALTWALPTAAASASMPASEPTGSCRYPPD